MPVLMPSPVFRWFVASTGAPASGYKAKFFDAGTATPKTIYEDDGTPYPSPSNTAILNAEGYAVIKLGTGTYKIQVTDALDNVVFTEDNLTGSGSFGTGFVDTVIASDATGLKDADTTSNKFVWCSGYYAKGDGGHGFFWNETSSSADDGGYVIASTFDPTKRWFRVPDESGDVRAASFGYIGTKAGDLSNQLLAASSYATGHGHRLTIGSGNTATISTNGGDFLLYALYGLHFEPGSMLTGTTFPNLVMYGPVTGSPEQHFTGPYQPKFQTAQVNANPEWFGASLFSGDNTAAFTKWFASLIAGGAYTLPPGDWYYSNTTAFPYPTLPFTMLGTIHATTGSNIPTGLRFPATSVFGFHQALFNTGGTITDGGGGAIAVVGNLGVTGDGAYSGELRAIGQIISDTNVVAGAVHGKPYGRAGYGDEYASGGRIYSNTTPVSTSGTTLTNLMSFSLLSNTLENAGDSLTIRCFGQTAGSSQQLKNMTLYIGGVVIEPFNITIQNGRWNFTAEIILSDPTHFSINWESYAGEPSPPVVVSPYSSTCAAGLNTITWSANNLIQLQSQALVSGSNTQYSMTIDYKPSP